MATNPPSGDNHRNGAVFVKRNAETGRFMDVKQNGTPFKGGAVSGDTVATRGWGISSKRDVFCRFATKLECSALGIEACSPLMSTIVAKCKIIVVGIDFDTLFLYICIVNKCVV